MRAYLLMFLAGAFFANLSWAQVASVRIKVNDEEGSPVGNATVGVGFQQPLRPGGGWGNVEKVLEGVTGTNGVYEAKWNCTGIIGTTANREGYYFTTGGYRFTNAVSGRWQPWNPTIELTLKKKGNPVAMYARKVNGWDKEKLPVLDKAVGYDLMKGDWVAPYGIGETNDFIFTLTVKDHGIDPANRVELYDMTMLMTFTNDGDGIQSVYAAPHVGSVLHLPRLAPESGYLANWGRRKQWKSGVGLIVELPEGYGDKNDLISGKEREDQNYIFRVRTKKNDKGSIVSALYGKIYGRLQFATDRFVAFTYYLNPTPNDRNIEFDPDKNLFKNLTSLQEAWGP